MLSSLRENFHRYVQDALALKGYQLQRITPFDLRLTEESPRDILLSHAGILRRSLLVEVPLTHCRSALGVAPDERHPFVATLTNGVPKSYEGSELEDYYRECRPATAAEALGVPPDEAPGYSNASPFSYLMPWYGTNPEHTATRRGQRMAEEAAEHGFELSSGGLTHFGPVAHAKGALEVERLRKLYHSMSEVGFVRSDAKGDDVTGALLTDSSGRWCVYIGCGQHRVAIAAVLGFNSIPVRIESPPVKREEVSYWPQVVRGRITPEAALTVFERVMAGDPPQVCQLPTSDAVDTVSVNHRTEIND